MSPDDLHRMPLLLVGNPQAAAELLRVAADQLDRNPDGLSTDERLARAAVLYQVIRQDHPASGETLKGFLRQEIERDTQFFAANAPRGTQVYPAVQEALRVSKGIVQGLLHPTRPRSHGRNPAG